MTRSSSARRLEDERIISTVGSGQASTPWYSQSDVVALSPKSCNDRPNPRGVLCQTFRSRRSPGPSERIGDRGRRQLHRTSPPAAKLGAGVEKSPGPSLFYAFAGWFAPRVVAQAASASCHGLSAWVRDDSRQPLRARGAGALSSALETASTSPAT